MSRKMNQSGIDLIKSFEGFRADAYVCPAGVLTIGYGHTGDVRQGQRVTQQQAEQLLGEDVADAEKAVARLIAVDLTDNQFAALVSFTFNLGTGSLSSSTLRRKLNQSNYGAVPSELARWVKAKGETLSGLVKRRAAEGLLFLQPDDAPASTDATLMPQRIESIDGSVHRQVLKGYLDDDINIERGSVDDLGDERYVHLSQNVPDGYVVQLQHDMRALGFTEVGQPDGAFGSGTKKAVQAFQDMAHLFSSGIVDCDTKDAIFMWLEKGLSKNHSTDTNNSESVIAFNGMQLITPRVPHFSQGDARWAQRVLGSGSSIQRKGCAISCIAMILSFYGRSVTPGVLDSYLDANAGYVGNSVKWSVAGRCGESDAVAKLKYARKSGSADELGAFLSDRVDKNLPTMVRVDYASDENIIYNHFVICVGRMDNGDFLMNDPATRHGDGYEQIVDDNIIQRTTRKRGYRIVKLDYYDPEA